ncbi:MAG: hypothetical protein ACXAE3_01480 [Candidatus Kariarchaeaceae archaeon]|jgi:hypothetical protein
MISNSIRAWNTQQGRKPCVFLYHNTTTGIFSLTEVEAEVTEPLLPLEQLALALIGHLSNVTRIEVHAFSGISLDICQDTLESLHLHGLVKVREYDSSLLFDNIKTLTHDIGDDWYTPIIKKITQRKLLKQYELTDMGLKSVKTLTKTVVQTKNFDIIVTGEPFYLFYDTFDIKTDGYEMVDMDPNLTKHLLGHTEQFSKYTGIKPLAIGPSTITEGKEISNAQFWITLQGNPEDHIDETKNQVFITSPSFERWSNPDWNPQVQEILGSIGFEFIEDFVIQSMSKTWSMVDEVIEESLSLSDDGLTWKLETDLEMQKLIFNSMPDPIARTETEIKLRLPDSSWRVVILVRLEPYDDLALKSLVAGRFHQIVPRKGFTLEEGYLDYTEMMREWDKDVSRDDYFETLETLVTHGCLIERFPDIDTIVVDVDDVLSENRRDTQNWQFSRLRQLDKLMEENEISDVKYCATKAVKSKIDEEEALQEWIDEGKIEIVNNARKELPEVLEIARDNKAHYIGSKLMKKGKKYEEYSRALEYFVTKNRVQVPGLEPFYDWQIENIFDKLYNIYYE